MPIADALLPEFDKEMASTRQLLERVPEATATWKPHQKSYSLGDLAMHIANIPTWTAISLTQTEFDIGAPPDPDAPSRHFESTETLLAAFDANVAGARSAVAGTSDQEFGVSWTLKNGDATVFTLPRIAVMRFVSKMCRCRTRTDRQRTRVCDVPCRASQSFSPAAMPRRRSRRRWPRS